MSDRGQHPSPSEPGTPLEDTGVPDSGGSPYAAPAEPYATPAEPFAAPAERVFEIDADRPEPEPDSAPRRRTRTIVLAGLLTVSLAGAAALGYWGWQINTQRHTTLSIPPTIGSLKLDDSEDATGTADYLQSALSAEISMDKAVGGVYSTDEGKNVLFFGGTTLLWSPEKDLDSSFDLLGDEEGGVTGLREVDAGDLGGTMKCGTTKSDGIELAVCGWADHGSLALAMFLDRPESEAAPLMREIREATQTRD